MRHVMSLVLAIVIVLGVVAYARLSSEALAVLAGGIVTAVILVPAFVLLIVISRRSQQSMQPPQPPQQQPTVIVVGGAHQLPKPQQAADPWAVDGAWRPAEDKPQFKVLGED